MIKNSKAAKNNRIKKMFHCVVQQKNEFYTKLEENPTVILIYDYDKR